MPIARIESLDREGRGVAHADGKTIFVDGALTGEDVEYAAYRKKPSWELAQTLRIEREGPSGFPRAAPSSAPARMLDAARRGARSGGRQQRVLETRCGPRARARPETMLRPCTVSAGDTGTGRGCRSAGWKRRAGRVGFRERKSSYVTDMTELRVLPPKVSRSSGRCARWSTPWTCRRVSPDRGGGRGRADGAVLRVLEPVAPRTASGSKRFAEGTAFSCGCSRRPDSAHPFWPLDAPELHYTLPQYEVASPSRDRFSPGQPRGQTGSS